MASYGIRVKLASLLRTVIVLFAVALALTATAADTDSFVRDFYAAYKAKDAAGMARFYTADATLVDPTFELDLKGPDQIRELLAKALAKYESIDWQIAHSIKAGDDLVVEGNMLGKIGGKTLHVPFVSIFHFRDGKISAQRDMFDVTHFLGQLGVMAPPFGPKLAAASASPTSSKFPPTPGSRELFETIARMDTVIFDTFNAHNVEALMAMFTEDLEFYQDNDGLKNHQETFGDFTKMFASVPDIRRELVKGSLEVYPIKDYGALEIGTH